LPVGIPEGEALGEFGLWAEGAHELGEAGVGLTQVSCHQFGKAGIFVIVYDGGVRVARKPDYILDAMALTEG
jgi:hypothetical protein